MRMKQGENEGYKNVKEEDEEGEKGEGREREGGENTRCGNSELNPNKGETT